MRDGLTWFGRSRASLSRRLSRSNHGSRGGITSHGSASSPGGRRSSSGGVTSGGSASPRPRASACTSHVHRELDPPTPPTPVPSGVDALRDVPYADAASLPLAPEDSFSERRPAQEATLPLGAPLSAPAAPPDSLVPDSPRVQVALTLTLTLSLTLIPTPTPTLSLTLTLFLTSWRCRGRPRRRLSLASRLRAARPPQRPPPFRSARASVRASRASAARAPHRKHHSRARSRQPTDGAAQRRGGQARTSRSGACAYVISSSCRPR